MRQAKQVCREMLLGLLLWMFLAGFLLAVIASHKLAALAGMVVGTTVAAGMILHMYRHLDIALDMDAKHAQTHTQVAAFQRMFVMGAAVAVAMLLSEYVHPVGVVLGLFGIKLTALANPLIHKWLQKYRKKRQAKKSSYSAIGRQ